MLVALSEAGGYVTAAYSVFVAMVVVYLAIIGSRMARVQRQLQALGDDEGEL
jgi:hypothetical protein